MQLAIKSYKDGNLQQAEHYGKKVLKTQSNNIDFLNFLGVINYELRNFDSSIKYFKKALKYNPNFADACYNIGNALREKGELYDAIIYYQKALHINPSFAPAYNNLGIIYQNIQELDKAISHFQKAIQLNPSYSDSYYNLGNVFREKKQFNEALTYYRKALQLNPKLTGAYNNLASILQEKKQFNEAIECYRNAIQKNPNNLIFYFNLGNLLKEQGRREEAIDVYTKVLNYQPNCLFACLGKCMSQLPIFYPNQSSIQNFRESYYAELIRLCETVRLETKKDIEDAATAVGSNTPFLLAYQGLNDRELQRIYGELICRIMASKYPQWANIPEMPDYKYGEPLRIGIVSGFFRMHSNWKIPIKGWIENIDNQKFHLYGYYTQGIEDNETNIARLSFKRFIEKFQSFEDLCQIIRDDNLHVLIYPEIGMDTMTTKLAALRLAPIQCVSWGHPETSGFPTIDYFLSSDLMEPPNANEHYTEKLIRLPNLSIYYEPPYFLNLADSRKEFGLHPKSIVYHCCQSVFKYLPQYDMVFPSIAQQVENCQFLFSSHRRSSLVTEQFQSRIKYAFRMFGLNPDKYSVFLPYLDLSRYNSLYYLANVFLDPIGWSGCNSALEAIACNLPIVTYSGEFMRNRGGLAILTMLGMQETIASSVDEYIKLAVRLGKDLEWRHQISKKIALNKHCVYRDRSCITALEDFLEQAVKERL